jgi:hypothetical protein
MLKRAAVLRGWGYVDVRSVTGAELPRDRLRIMRIIARMNVGGPAVQASLLTTSLDTDPSSRGCSSAASSTAR